MRGKTPWAMLRACAAAPTALCRRRAQALEVLLCIALVRWPSFQGQGLNQLAAWRLLWGSPQLMLGPCPIAVGAFMRCRSSGRCMCSSSSPGSLAPQEWTQKAIGSSSLGRDAHE